MPQRREQDDPEENRNEEGGTVRYVRRRRNRYPYAEPGSYPEGGEPSYYQSYVSGYTPDEDATWLGGSGSSQNDWIDDGIDESDVGHVSSGLDEEVGTSAGGGGGGVGDDIDAAYPLADYPIAGSYSGQADKAARAREEAAAERDREVWRNLAGTAPTVDQLAGDTYLEASEDEYGDLIGDPSQFHGFGASADQHVAQSALRSLYESGGYTDADQSARRLGAMERGQQLRGANQAALQQAYARGGGGGGMELGARLSGTQALSQGQAMHDAAVDQAAMMRAYGALQSFQGGANTMQEQEMARRAALDNFNQQNNDWRRNRESRNTAWTNRGEERRGDAYQQAYRNREGVAQGLTRFSPYGNSEGQLNRQAERDAGIFGALGEIFDL